MENPSSLPQQPDPKKLKMSTTSDDEGLTTAAEPGSEKKPRYKRRKVAIFFAYCGVGYQGMQKNPGAKTIEGDLEEALYLAGAVPDHDRGCPQRYDWARSARTDKGVSAVGQVVSGRFYIDPPGLIDRLHQNLPSQFRIFGYKRVTGSFNAKKFCDRRRYVYLMPAFALDPSAHRDRESVLASLGSGNELAKCFECSERGRKVVGVMGKRSYEFAAVESGISSNSCVTPAADGIVSNLESKLESSNSDSAGNDGLAEIKEGTVNGNDSNLEGTKDFATGSDILKNNGTTTVLQVEEHTTVSSGNGIELDNSSSVSITEKEEVNGELDGKGSNGDKIDGGKGCGFCYGDKEKERFNRILKLYEGTHNFHNFTTRTKAADPAARRYIISFQANTTVTVDGIEFVKCEVVGQSFMLHQIRKMIGVAVAIMRNCAPESLIETALQQDLRITVPTAPEVGLYLDECFFTSYNKKWEDTHEEVSMKDYIQEAEDFKMKHIYTHIASMEHKEGAVGLWLHSLNYRNYPDLRGEFNSSSDGIKGTVGNSDEMKGVDCFDEMNVVEANEMSGLSNKSGECGGHACLNSITMNRLRVFGGSAPGLRSPRGGNPVAGSKSKGQSIIVSKM